MHIFLFMYIYKYITHCMMLRPLTDAECSCETCVKPNLQKLCSVLRAQEHQEEPAWFLRTRCFFKVIPWSIWKNGWFSWEYVHLYIYMPYKNSHMLMLHSPLMALAEVVTVVSSVDGS